MKWYFGDKPLSDVGKIAILNNSPIFGKPIFKILAGFGASAKIFNKTDIYSESMTDYFYNLSKSDVILSAVSNPSFELPLKKLKRGALIVDVANFNVRIGKDMKELDINLIKNVGPITMRMLKLNLLKLIDVREGKH